MSFTAPSGPPQTLRAVAISSTSIRLTWTAPLPEEQNGVIVSYRITVTDVESREVVQQTSSSASLLIVDSLNPYHTYQCSIAATTIAVGPEAFVEVTTFQEGNYFLQVLHSLYIFVSWFQHQLEVHEM